MSLRILDVSMNDGWMLANLWQGRDVMNVQFERLDGMDLNRDAAARAEGRRQKYGWEGKLVCDDLHTAPEHFEPGTYDAVVCMETIEHVPDPRATLAVLVRMCKPDGRIYLSTPEGAYERGNVPGWNVVEHKGHLRAIRPEDFVELACEVGIVEDFRVGPDRVMFTAIRPRAPRGKVVFFAGGGFVQPLPEKMMLEGLGGSETALCRMAEQFARKGYDVRVYAGDGEGGIRGDHCLDDTHPDPTGNVLYRPAAAWDPGERCDLFISSRVPEVFDRTIAAERRALWLHDADYGERLSPERVERCTDVVVLSEFQRELLVGKYPHLADKLYVSRNGVELSLFADQDDSRRPWVVYSSSPDRGLDILLEVWPQVREQVPDAELHTAYAPVYYQMAALDPGLAKYHAYLQQLLADTEGVVNHVSLGQRALAELYCRSAVWAYPSWTTLYGGAFPEISCISAMEAQAAGCYPVVLDHGALRETLKTGVLIPGDATSDEWQAQFVDEIVRGLTDRKHRGRAASRGRLHAANLGWDGVADDWCARFLSEVREAVPA